jgi:autotransporter-associated beta strand protein
VNNGTLNLGGGVSTSALNLPAFTRTGGTVNLTGTLDNFGTTLTLTPATGDWNLVAGTIHGGTIASTGGATLYVTNTGFPVLDGVTVAAGAIVDLTTSNNITMIVKNGMVLNSTINVGKTDGSMYATMYFGDASGSGKLLGTGTILLGGNTNNGVRNDSNAIGNSGTLTLDTTIMIHGKSGLINNDYPTGKIINNGTIAADVSGGTITVGGTGTISNVGTMSASNGGTLALNGVWSNTNGTLTENGGTLNLAGSFTTSGLGLGKFTRTGGTVNITGTLTGSLPLTATTGSWVLNGGTIKSGTYSATGGAILSVNSGTLDTVTANSDIDVTPVNGAQLVIKGGLPLNGTMSLGAANASTYGSVYFGDSTATPPVGPSGNAIFLFGGSTNNAIVNYSSGVGALGQMTIPATVTIHGKSGQITSNYSTGSIVSAAPITADIAGGTITLGGSAFTNNGSIEAAAGNITLNVINFVNNGVLKTSGGTFTIGSSANITNAAGSSLINTGGTFTFNTAVAAPSLTLANNGTLNGSGNFSTPTFSWTGGTMSGSGKTTVASGATMTISGTDPKTLSRTIDNSGTTSWTDGQILTSSGTFNNLAGGVFSTTAANSFFNSGGTNLFNNAGAFAKNSPSVTVFGIPFTNQAAGVVNVNDGTLALLGGGTNFGTINIANGATARFGGTFNHAAGSTLSGTGNIDFNTTAISLDGNLIIDGELTFNSASATVKAGATVTKLSLTGSSATVAAGGVLTVGSGGVNFTGSTNNTVTLQPSATTPGLIVLKGNVNDTATDGTAVLNTANFTTGQTPGLMDLFGATRTFSISDGAQAIDLSVSGRIMNGGIIKSGAGTLRLDSPNTYTGGTTISAGTLEVLDPAGLSTGGVTIGDATLSLKSDLASPVTFGNNVTVTGDAAVNVDRISVGNSGVYRLGNVSIGATRLSVTGANRSLEIGGLALSGNATLNTAANLTINGPITESVAGMGITKSTGTAKLTIGGSTANTYTGLTRINAGPVELNKPAGVTAVGGDLQVFGGSVKLLADQQIANTGAVSVANAGSSIDFAGHSETMGAFSVTGNATSTVGATGTASQLGTAMLRVTSLTVNTGGKLDLANNRLIDDYSGSTPITSIRTAIAAGYANGAWTGPGIQSSSAIANPTRALGYADASDVLAFANGATSDTFLGSTVDKTTMLIRYTLAGDANLDGTVDFLDLSRLAQNYNVTDGTRTWAQGDYNYDGNVDFSDLAKLAQSYNTTLPGGAAAIPAGAPAGFEADLARAFAEVPEPSALVMLTGLAAVAVMGRRRRCA